MAVRAHATELNNVSNDAKRVVQLNAPYTVHVTIEGICPILFHRWSCDDVEAKANAAKGSKARKTDNIENYLYRTSEGFIALPSEHLRMSVVTAAKFRQDPRSPRKSAMDLVKAGLAALEELCPITNAEGHKYKEPDYIDRRRVTIQRSAITRQRPAMHAGWRTTVPLMCNLPEYIPPSFLNELIQSAGRLCGVGTFRPTFGRFVVVKFEEV